jgi:hypothetical protein
LQAGPDSSDWSDTEALLLLEGVELYGDNWGEIAQHVGTRSQVAAPVPLPITHLEPCATHFSTAMPHVPCIITKVSSRNRPGCWD